jgi:copper chaperone CopZ
VSSSPVILARTANLKDKSFHETGRSGLFPLAFAFYNTTHSSRTNTTRISKARYPHKRPAERRFAVKGRVRVQGGKVEMKAELHIGGMHCDSCAVDIKETLEETAGVKEADVTFKRKTAIVEFDEQTVQQSTLVKKIQDLGYTATVSGESQSEVGA